jgi:SAM-dependent methyltransferase
VDAQAWDERYSASELVWSTGPNQFVAAELGDLAAGRALDLAAGEGRNSLWLASRGWQVVAVDFSRVALDKGRALEQRQQASRPGSPPVDWVVADALTFEPPTGLDLVLLAYLQLPADQRRTAVRRAFGCLGVGGTFLLVAHDSSNLTEGTGGPQDPEVLFTAEEALGDLDGERFEVVRAERVARVVGPDDEHAGHGGTADGRRTTAYDCLVRVVRTG